MLKKSQWKLNLGFSFFILFLILLLIQVSLQLTLVFAVSLAIGFTLQKSRFCFTSAFRDPLLVGVTNLTQAVILLLVISVPGFAIAAAIADMANYPLSLYVSPFGVHTVIGGILFGIGMVLAGGCSSGVLMRIGEGFAMQMIAFVGLLIGAFLGKYSLPFWQTSFGEVPGIFLPDKIGWLPAVAVQLFILLVLWKVTRWWQKKQNGVG
ncbi:MAG: YeeE/YedE family protein [Peptococcaceae bacterium]|nr:YeeE/YedE family protein [Peptococcaceae bacterium]